LASSRIYEPEPEQINDSHNGEEDFGREDNSSDEYTQDDFTEFKDETAQIQMLRREELSKSIFMKD